MSEQIAATIAAQEKEIALQTQLAARAQGMVDRLVAQWDESKQEIARQRADIQQAVHLNHRLMDEVATQKKEIAKLRAALEAVIADATDALPPRYN
jgi:septal ring factor EnvC (AmiA/AmiB activator)